MNDCAVCRIFQMKRIDNYKLSSQFLTLIQWSIIYLLINTINTLKIPITVQDRTDRETRSNSVCSMAPILQRSDSIWYVRWSGPSFHPNFIQTNCSEASASEGYNVSSLATQLTEILVCWKF